MATVSISLYQVRETVEEGYRVTNEITASVDIEEQLFTFKYIDGTPEWLGGKDQYQHVSTVSDNKNYPAVTTTPYVPSSPVDYYRYKKVVLDYGSLNGAIDQAAITKTRMEELVTDWQMAVDTFEAASGDHDYQSADGQVSFTLEQVQSQPANNNFRVLSTIKTSPAPVGIERELFLFELIGATPNPSVDTFIRVVTTDDLSRWKRYAEWGAGEQYYRYFTAPVDHPLLGEAETHSETVRTDLEALAQDYDISTDDFVGSETTVYTG